ncbi:uncharacterized protein LOC130590443 [Beta vulgaris subsp. vulgaris]|uniref:uncharacterized protein LOC130590443 n=1 Tax=Beta vulgaris subsp. vulgaris TaxID=3555 RepID=UPI002549700F|nr:uncharacterized protein LOC130590443 [Beta vulgaris subsp. vulgaris]
MFKKFSSLNPPSYDGKPDPVAFEDWINRIDQLFETLQCPEKWRVDFAVFYLTGQASLWWKIIKEKKNEPGFGWSKLQDLMRDKFYPPSLRKQKEDEFLHLQQGTMSVLEYANKFMELSRFAPELVTSEQSRMNRFERVLLRESQNSNFKRRNDWRNDNQGGAKRPNQGSQNFRRNDSGQSDYRGQGYHGGNRVQSNFRAPVNKPSSVPCVEENHSEANVCWLKCFYRCGSRDHCVRDCLKPPGANNSIGGTSSAGTNRN